MRPLVSVCFTASDEAMNKLSFNYADGTRTHRFFGLNGPKPGVVLAAGTRCAE